VLPVDDEPVFVLLATRILNDAGLDVVGTAGDAAAVVLAAAPASSSRTNRLPAVEISRRAHLLDPRSRCTGRVHQRRP
jgi:hypothetical protein